MSDDFENKKAVIATLIEKAEELLEEARDLSADLVNPKPDAKSWETTPVFIFDGPAYGMGGGLKNGEWFASSESCRR